MKKSATNSEVRKVIERAEKEGLTVQVNQLEKQQVLGLVGDTRLIQDVAFLRYEGVENVERITNTYKLTSRIFHPQDTVVDVNGVKIGAGNFVLSLIRSSWENGQADWTDTWHLWNH